MQTISKTTVNVENTVNAQVDKVWKFMTDPEHIKKWNNASADWHTIFAENDLREGGKFLYRMEAKDASAGFDFKGVYDKVKTNQLMEYTIADGRKVKISFESHGTVTIIKEKIEVDNRHSVDIQKDGWQAILNNFKKYVETHP